MKTAFTLAEVLITLGIIGVVAAMTIPTLISKYQKQVYYTQFMKAATVLENAINQYNFDYSCGTCIKNDNYYSDGCDNLCLRGIDSRTISETAADRLAKYMNVVKSINEDNYEEVCEGYKKLPPAHSYDGTERDTDDWCHICDNKDLQTEYENGYGFITNNGMLFNFAKDRGVGSGSIVDTNGTKGPNIYGRDIFVFYLFNSPSERWGLPKEADESCFDDDKNGYNCGRRLLQEGKMNY